MQVCRDVLRSIYCYWSKIAADAFFVHLFCHILAVSFFYVPVRFFGTVSSVIFVHRFLYICVTYLLLIPHVWLSTFFCVSILQLLPVLASLDYVCACVSVCVREWQAFEQDLSEAYTKMTMLGERYETRNTR